jgi:hypothetical protein
MASLITTSEVTSNVFSELSSFSPEYTITLPPTKTNLSAVLYKYKSICHISGVSEQGCHTTRHEGAWGERRYSSYSLSTSALDGVSGQRHVPAALFPRERTPGTHCTEGWVGPRAGLDTEEKYFRLCRGSNLDRPVVQPVARHCTD